MIRFFRVRDDYGCFSNFAPYPINIMGKLWPTSEHYFQAQKFTNPEYQEKIRTTKSPMIAARLGRSRQHPLRSDWETTKMKVMEEALRAKFTQHKDLMEILLGTSDAKIVEHTKRDRFWGDGGDETGSNQLGKLLMQIRAEMGGFKSRG